jgi:protein-S-isoprenylcysteine O-methyltransferase Ste14
MKAPQEGLRLPVPPPLIMLVFVIVGLVFGELLPIPIPFPAWMRIAGLLVTLGGLVLGLSAVTAMRRAGTPVDPRTPSTKIVAGGPFRFSRNPIYLSFLAMVAGAPLMFGSYWGLALAPVALDAYTRLVIEREEAFLECKFGQIYLEYKARVRRWL